MGSFETTYRSHFKPVERGFQYPANNTKLVRTKTINEQSPFVAASEGKGSCSPVDLANEYLNSTVKPQKPKVASIHFKEPLDKAEIEYELQKGTVYCRDYCKFKRGVDKKELGIKINVTEPAETSMQDHYRRPDQFTPMAPYTKAKGSDHTLTQNHYIVTSILKDTPISEYQTKIGAMGQLIIDNEMHGKITYPS